MKWLALALLLPACDLLFGIDPVPPAIEVNRGTVTVTYTLTVATQTASGPTIATGVAAANDYLDLRAQLLDGTNLPITRTSPTTFEFTLPPGAAYILRTQTKDATTPTEFQTSAAALNLVDYALDRYDALPAMQPIPINYVVHYASPEMTGDYPFLVALGARAQVNFDGGDVNAPQLTDWRQAITNEGVHGPLLSTTQYQDRLVFERWETDGTTVQWMNDALVDPIEMVDGQSIDRGMTGAEVAIPPLVRDRCAHIDAPRMTELERLADLTGFSMVPGTGWAVMSTVSLTTPPANLFALAANYDATADQQRDVHYGSPFPNEVDLALLGVNAQRPLAIPGTAAPMVLTAGTTHLTAIPPSTASACVPVSFVAAGLCSGVTLADQVLATDAQIVMIDRSQRVPFELTIEGGPYDDARVALDEVVDDNGQTALRRITAFHISSDPPTASIDPTLLVHNHYYLFSANTRLGFPRSRALDLGVVTYPYANTQTFSTMFKVGN